MEVSVRATLIGLLLGFLAGLALNVTVVSVSTPGSAQQFGSSLTEVTRSRTPIAQLAPASSKFNVVKLYVGSAKEQLPERKRPQSQCGQDWSVLTLSGCKSQGYFVDIASNDARKLSNTWFLEKFGNWGGVCIEANAEYMYGYSGRQCSLYVAAVGTPVDSVAEFVFRGVYGGIVGDEMRNKQARPDQVHKLPLAALSDILMDAGAPAVIDYLSLDVEGAETLVMTDFPYGKYTFKIITVELPQPELRRQFQRNGYRMLFEDSIDETWLHAASWPNFEDVRGLFRDENRFTGASCLAEAGVPQPPPKRACQRKQNAKRRNNGG
mmetsp:Transcript_53371/g.100086  ORF Transcript_53371/g.100086 Transcript_53371/m.100086 type:complete len:323 (-) Transcript_53371:35-1003(-)